MFLHKLQSFPFCYLHYRERFFVNVETGKQIAGPLEDGWDFHEGLAVAKRVNQEYQEVIDRNGKVI